MFQINLVANLFSNLFWLHLHPQGPVFVYYGLSNYFQNYRKYGASKDADQLTGDLAYFAVKLLFKFINCCF